jgi:hypothetical protein
LPIFGWAHVSSPSISGPPTNAHHVPNHPKNICFTLFPYTLLHGGQAAWSRSLRRPNYTLQSSILPQHMPSLRPLQYHTSPIYLFRLPSSLPSSQWYKGLNYTVQRSGVTIIGP